MEELLNVSNGIKYCIVQSMMQPSKLLSVSTFSMKLTSFHFIGLRESIENNQDFSRVTSNTFICYISNGD